MTDEIRKLFTSSDKPTVLQLLHTLIDYVDELNETWDEINESVQECVDYIAKLPSNLLDIFNYASYIYTTNKYYYEYEYHSSSLSQFETDIWYNGIIRYNAGSPFLEGSSTSYVSIALSVKAGDVLHLPKYTWINLPESGTGAEISLDAGDWTIEEEYIHDGIIYVCIQVSNSHPLEDIVAETYLSVTTKEVNDNNITSIKSSYLENDIAERVASLVALWNPLYKKTLITIGTSMTYGQSSSNTGYGQWIADRNDMTFFNMGVNSGRLTTATAGTVNKTDCTEYWLGNDAANWYSTVGSTVPDYVVIEFGPNDGSSVELGTVSAVPDEDDYSTFYGCLYKWYHFLNETYPGVKILFLTSWKSANSETCRNAVIEWCDYWLALYYDSWAKSGSCNTSNLYKTNFPNLVEYMRYNSSSTDYTHFSADGYKYLSYIIEGQLKLI